MKRLTFGFLFLLALGFVACTSSEKKSAPAPVAPAYNDLFARAKMDLARKDTRSAFNKFHKIINDQPSSELAAQSHLLIADYYFSQNRMGDAYAEYMKIVNGPVKVSFESTAGIRAAQCLLNQDKTTESLAQVDKVLNTPNLSKEENTQALKLRAQLLKRMNAPLEELKTLLYLHAGADTESQKQEYKLQALGLVEGTLNPTQLDEVANDPKYSFTQAPALFRIGLLSFERSEFSRARATLERVVSISPNSELSERANEMLNQIRARELVNPKRVGVILPLSGKLAKVGYKTLHGIQLGLGIYGKNSSGLELAVIDSGGNPASARRAVEKLVIDDHVVAIIGALSSKEATAVASKAQEFGVPNIALSQKAGLTEIGDYVFRNALTSEMQVKQLVSEAIGIRGIKRFAILYPKDAYGSEYANLFWDEVVKQGGEIRAIQSYKPGETDFGAPIKRMVGTSDPEARKVEYKLRLEEWKKNTPAHARKQTPTDLLPPIQDFEAVFIPDGAKALGQIAPMLAYNDIRDVVLIGTNLWNTPATLERAGKFLKAPLFVDSYLSSDPALANSQFFRDFNVTFGEVPEEFEVQAYDSAVILRKTLESGATSRVDIQAQLAKLNQIPGAIGALTMTPTREVARPVVVLTIKDNQIMRTQDAQISR